MDNQTVWGVIGAIGTVATLFGLAYKFRKPKHTRRIKKLSAEKRLELLTKVLKFNRRLTINLDGSVFIFMPNGENIFGAGWTNYGKSGDIILIFTGSPCFARAQNPLGQLFRLL